MTGKCRDVGAWCLRRVGMRAAIPRCPLPRASVAGSRANDEGALTAERAKPVAPCHNGNVRGQPPRERWGRAPFWHDVLLGSSLTGRLVTESDCGEVLRTSGGGASSSGRSRFGFKGAGARSEQNLDAEALTSLRRTDPSAESDAVVRGTLHLSAANAVLRDGGGHMKSNPDGHRATLAPTETQRREKPAPTTGSRDA